jgi:REP element-mobilizing transposase RayT
MNSNGAPHAQHLHDVTVIAWWKRRQAQLRLVEADAAAIGYIAGRDYGCAIHGYVLMTNHVHLLITPRIPDSLLRTMQSLGRRYVRNVNATYRRTGTLWEGRPRAAPIDSEACFLACCSHDIDSPLIFSLMTYYWMAGKRSISTSLKAYLFGLTGGASELGAATRGRLTARVPPSGAPPYKDAFARHGTLF